MLVVGDSMRRKIQYSGISDLYYIYREIWAWLNKKKVIKYLEKSENKEIYGLTEQIRMKIAIFPYEYIKDYHWKKVNVKKDKDINLFYVNRNGRRIYLKRKYKSEFRARRYFSNILLEQDIKSPHRYMDSHICIDEETVVIDVGGAEGLFVFDYLDTIKHAYIIDCDELWIEALSKTYFPYKDKVTIIKSTVTDNDIHDNITLDYFIKEHKLTHEKLLIKIDAEGHECEILEGARELITNMTVCDILICAYHRQDDEQEIRKRLGNWDIRNSNGYMLYYYDFDFAEPYLRRGVLRCKKRLK